jgi:hypothetical protein
MSAVRIRGPVPVNSQKAVIVCECSAIALPRILFSRLLPSTNDARMTTGENGPNLAVLPIVHRGATVTAAGATAAAGRRQTKADAAIEAVAGRNAAPDGVAKAARVVTLARACISETLCEQRRFLEFRGLRRALTEGVEEIARAKKGYELNNLVVEVTLVVGADNPDIRGVDQCSCRLGDMCPGVAARASRPRANKRL